MQLKVLTTCDKPDHPGYLRLKASLDKFGYDYECLVRPFRFGHQLPIIREWCNSQQGYTHILYTDAFDTLAFAPPLEVIDKWPEDTSMVISGEKNCYPYPGRAGEYPEGITPWKYVNGGGWMVEIEFFKWLCTNMNLNDDSHDQVWLMDAFLKNQPGIKIDTQCNIFQSIAFSYKEEWRPKTDTYELNLYQRFENIGTGRHPIFFHGNGHTEMDWLTL